MVCYKSIASCHFQDHAIAKLVAFKMLKLLQECLVFSKYLKYSHLMLKLNVFQLQIHSHWQSHQKF